ncbi:tyrosine-type recombinase/integrase [Amnibacterium kyonggiense]|uniref:Site-specific recombinase XerD n=1 Tax=Amnibacterium kyonggiense TaxID=595671 RepID=A0A4R7FG73_9MICO|nr:site-specific integrase [Amnibacterium kyonggiense]TDS75930.1 site-specific recombinase XerD [Amnibacterium kyonggiense]
MASIQKRPNGSWRARYRDAAGREHATHRATKREAQRWLDEQTASIVSGTYVDPRAGGVTLRAYYADWGARQLWETNTRQAMELALRQCPFADQPIKTVKRSDVELWVKALTVAGLAPLTVHQRVDNIRRILRSAVRDRIIAADPTAGVVLPRKRRREARMTIPSTEDVGALYAAAEDWFKPFVALCAFAGLRFGEANGVQLGDVDFLRRTLDVRRQVQRIAPHPLEIRGPKYGSERTVHLADGLLQILSGHIETVGVYGTDRWLLVGREDGPAWPRSLQYAWDKTARAAGLGTGNAKSGTTDVTPHQLRHFYASGLIAAGCDVVTVQRALGHASADITLRVYAHLWPDGNDRTRKAADDLLRTSLAVPADRVRTGLVATTA